MKKHRDDKRVVMTLDAGGTNFVFSAIKGCEELVNPITIPSNAHDLELSLKGMIEGFKAVKEQLDVAPVAISFAFPGPSDYPNGIIGDLGNLPGYKGGVALGAMLEEQFNMPVFVNNDGNLYALGEAAYGFLPYINEQLKEAGSHKRFKNLIGFTLGTGFGGGIVTNGNLLLGDNSDSSELWVMSNKIDPTENIEELVSIRGVVNRYKKLTKSSESITPKDIFLIAKGEIEGNKEAAIESYRAMGQAIGDALANLITLIDGVAVIGGGISAAAELFVPAMMQEVRSSYKNGNPHLSQDAYFIDNSTDMKEFLKDTIKEIKVPFSTKTVQYESHKRVAIGLSKIGTARAISIGAYIFALNELDNR